MGEWPKFSLSYEAQATWRIPGGRDYMEKEREREERAPVSYFLFDSYIAMDNRSTWPKSWRVSVGTEGQPHAVRFQRWNA